MMLEKIQFMSLNSYIEWVMEHVYNLQERLTETALTTLQVVLTKHFLQ